VRDILDDHLLYSLTLENDYCNSGFVLCHHTDNFSSRTVTNFDDYVKDVYNKLSKHILDINMGDNDEFIDSTSNSFLKVTIHGENYTNTNKYSAISLPL
jgi:hypothetical protein